MKAALYVLAFLLIGAGVGVGIASVLSPGQVIHGIDAGLAGTLLAAGFMVLGFAVLATSIDGLSQTLSRTIRLLEARATLAAEAAATTSEFAPARFHPAQEAEPLAKEAEEEKPEEEPGEEAPPILLGDESEKPEPKPEREALTLPALSDEPDPVKEAAKAKAASEAPAEEPEDEAEEPEDGELYVVEEREFRGRPARVLSDGTVEAETDEGWMRFENMEHLEEYMDAMASMARGA